MRYVALHISYNVIMLAIGCDWESSHIKLAIAMIYDNYHFSTWFDHILETYLQITTHEIHNIVIQNLVYSLNELTMPPPPSMATNVDHL